MNAEQVLQHLTKALVEMNPDGLVQAAAELDNLLHLPAEEWGRVAEGLKSNGELASASLSLFEEICALTALNSAGYSAQGMPAEWRHDKGAFCV